MAAPYALLNITRPHQLFTYSNNVTDGMFGTLVLIAFFAICFVSMKNYTTKRAFAASSIITTVLSGLFFILGIITPHVVFIAIIASAIGVVSLHLDKSS